MKTLSLAAGIASVLSCILAWELLPADGNRASLLPERNPTRAGANPNTAGKPNAGLWTVSPRVLLDRPLFSPDRRPAPVATAAAAVAVEEIPRLAGIITGPGGELAIFEDGSGHQHIAARGDQLGRFKIGTIAPGQVSLIASEGERVLRPRLAKSPGAMGVPVASIAGPAR
jgi:hypothetical protein